MTGGPAGELVRLQQVSELHRAEQASLAGRFVVQFRDLWPLLDIRRLDATQEGWLAAADQLVLNLRAQSAGLAAEHVQTVRQLYGVAGDAPVHMSEANLPAIRTSLLVTGPVNLKQRTARLVHLAEDAPDRQQPAIGQLVKQAANQALLDSARAGIRHVLDGGRQTQLRTVAADPAALGWVRVPKGVPCWFCAMLQSRGPVYKEHSFSRSDPRFTGHGTAKVHDGDACSLSPVYGDWPRSAMVDQLGGIWDSATAGKSGPAAARAFRAEYERQRPALLAAHAEPVPAAEVAPVAEPAPAVEIAPKPAELEHDLTVLSDDDLAERLNTAATAGDDAGLDRIMAELDRRDQVQAAEQKKAAKAARDKERRDAKRAADQAAMDAKYDELVAAGADPEQAFADAYGLDQERMKIDEAIASLRANGYTGRNFDELVRSAFKEFAEQAWLDAENVTNGYLLNKAGVAAGINPRALFSGPESSARKYASDELLDYWQQNGRPTVDDFKVSLLGGKFKTRAYFH